MKRLLVILSLFFTLLCCLSCITLMTVASIDRANVSLGRGLGKRSPRLELKTFQRLSDYAALATTGSGAIICIGADFRNFYYDGMVLSGRFVRAGTFTYRTILGTEKTVLCYMYRRHVRRLAAQWDRFLEEYRDTVVDDRQPVSI